MLESELTKRLKISLYYHTQAHKLGVYGAFEVACGGTLGYGKEFVDYMTMDSENIFRCYEVKVSKSDLHSPAAWSFYGDYNYFVVPEALSDDVAAFLKSMGEQRIGVLVAREVFGRLIFSVMRKPRKMRLGIEQRIANMHNMVRSGSRYTTKWVKQHTLVVVKDDFLDPDYPVSDEEFVAMFGHHKDFA